MIQLIYTTVSSITEAKKLAELLLDKKLAACIQTLNGINSFYKWEGKIVESEEIGVLIKTIKSDEVVNFLKKNHPYAVPCILFGSVNACQTFKVWVNEECDKECDKES